MSFRATARNLEPVGAALITALLTLQSIMSIVPSPLGGEGQGEGSMKEDCILNYHLYIIPAEAGIQSFRRNIE